jgi:hypothetical protein
MLIETLNEPIEKSLSLEAVTRQQNSWNPKALKEEGIGSAVQEDSHDSNCSRVVTLLKVGYRITVTLTSITSQVLLNCNLFQTLKKAKRKE